MATKLEWHKGPPPSIGWWPASYAKDAGIVRWWNGKVWGTACSEFTSPVQAARNARMAASAQGGIRWTERPANWPARSRT